MTLPLHPEFQASIILKFSVAIVDSRYDILRSTFLIPAIDDLMYLFFVEENRTYILSTCILLNFDDMTG